MANTTTNLGLKQWNLTNDHFDFTELSTNFGKIDAHDHTTGKGLQIPTDGIANGAVTQGKIAANAIGGGQLAGGSVTPAKLQGAPSLAIGQVPVMGPSGFVPGTPNGMEIGPFSSRPAFGIQGRQFYATDTGDVWLDTGTTWVFQYSTARCRMAFGSVLAPPGSSPVALRLNGTLTSTHAGHFTKTVVGGAEKIVITYPGRYRVGWTFTFGSTGSGTPSPGEVYGELMHYDGTNWGRALASPWWPSGSSWLVPLDSAYQYVSATAEAYSSVGDLPGSSGFMVGGYATGARSVLVRSCMIERVSP